MTANPMKHPLAPFLHRLERPRRSARQLGYRMPAEWEPMRRVWLTLPHNRETWPGCLGKARTQYRAFMRALRRFVEVKTTQSLGIRTDDSWIRDYGPIFVVRREPSDAVAGRAQLTEPRLGLKALHDFRFNSWGGKYEEQRPLDDVVPQHIAAKLGLPIWVHDLVLEGGSIDVNGRGTVMTTEQCLLNKNRNPRKSKAAIVREIHQALGTHHVIWLPGGILGDDTDGHIDDIARFLDPTTVAAVRAPRGHPDFDMLERNRRALRQARDQDGRKLTIVELPSPGDESAPGGSGPRSAMYRPLTYKFPPDRFGPGGVNPIPASYANFLIANGGVIVPIFGRRSDDIALRTLADAMPGYEIVGVRAEYLVVGLGSFHCLSQQEPV